MAFTTLSYNKPNKASQLNKYIEDLYRIGLVLKIDWKYRNKAKFPTQGHSETQERAGYVSM